MIRTSLLLMFAAAALAQTDRLANLGSGREVISGGGILGSGLGIRYRTVLTPANASLGSFGEGGIAVGADALHRSMVDRSRGTYFGYDLTIAASGNGNSYLATFQPLSDGFSAGTLRPLPLPKYPAPQVVRDGDIIELDLMVSPDGKQRLTDYIEIQGRASEPAAATITAEPRDFSLDDGPVSVDSWRMTIWIGGQKFQGTSGYTGKPGATFWVAPPGQGRYVLSLTPHEGFVKSGSIRDNVIGFEGGGQHFEIRFMTPVAGAGRAWNLYVLHDQTYQPRLSNGVSVGVDRLENLLPQR